MEVRVATVQMHVKENPQDNLDKALKFVDEAAQDRAKAICLPEYWLTGCPQKSQTEAHWKSLAEEIQGPLVEKFCRKAKNHSMYIVLGSLVEKDGDRLYNTSTLISPRGDVIGKVRKAHPENASAKAEVDCQIAPGEADYPVFNTEIGNLSVMVDMDACAFEVPRILGLKGAEIIFWPVCWDQTLLEAIHTYANIAAIASSAFVVISAPVGSRATVEGTIEFAGGSGIVHVTPHSLETGWRVGYTASMPDFEEGVMTASVDLKAVGRRLDYIKGRYPYWRRPKSYGLITDAAANAARHGGVVEQL